MYYHVKAKLKADQAGALLRKLESGEIATQKPDGGEIVKGLEGAVVNEAGEAEWSTVCYCSTPLAHERATVLDEYFEDLTTEVVDGYELYEGQSFIAYLQRVAEK